MEQEGGCQRRCCGTSMIRDCSNCLCRTRWAANAAAPGVKIFERHMWTAASAGSYRSVQAPDFCDDDGAGSGQKMISTLPAATARRVWQNDGGYIVNGMGICEQGRPCQPVHCNMPDRIRWRRMRNCMLCTPVKSKLKRIGTPSA